MFRNVRVAFAVLGVLALLIGTSASAQETKVKLDAQNNSGESGTATLTPAGDSTKVVLDVKGAEGTQPTHIHKGTCAKLDPKPSFPLSPVVNGKSETTVKASMKDLTSGGYAINGHKSAQDLKTYVFCGDIKAGM
ncbi:MAG TPA: hypothetical protein VGM22_19050 [Methylomirabilota bacterium]|jgi:hypothetical protein